MSPACPDFAWGEPLDEDTRLVPPALTLGPDWSHRYALDLNREVWAIDSSGRGLRVDEGASGWAVFDGSHQMVYRGEGRLLAGWGDAVVTLEDGELFRHSLRSRQIRPLGPAGEEIEAAVAVPETENVVVYRSQGEGSLRLRLV